MNYVIESDFVHKGLRCIVVGQRGGYRCGYVGLPSSHKLYGVDYSDKVLPMKNIANKKK